MELAQERGWTVGIIATPAGLGFIDVPKLESQTGNPVRSEYRSAGDRNIRSLPNAQAVIVAPATYNTICKLAFGISDTYALGTLAESIGRGIPAAILPFVNSALASRKPFIQAVRSLREEGVRIVFGPGEWEPHPPGTGGERIPYFPWSKAVDCIPSPVS